MNDTTTAILSGTNSPYSIRTFDWTTMQYYTQPGQFSKNRHHCGCALLQIDGQLLVAVSGKFSSRNISSIKNILKWYARSCKHCT